MKEYKASKKNGQAIIARAARFDGSKLGDVYSSYSAEKGRAFTWCYNQFLHTENAHNFHICSHNTFGFTVAWSGTENGEEILRMETKDNSYIVYMER